MPLSETERTGEDARNESEERGAGQRLDAREREGGRESATPTERATSARGATIATAGETLCGVRVPEGLVRARVSSRGAPDGGATARAPVLVRHGEGRHVLREHLRRKTRSETGDGGSVSAPSDRVEGDGDEKQAARGEIRRAPDAPCSRPESDARTPPPRRWPRGAQPAEAAWPTAYSRPSLCTNAARTERESHAEGRASSPCFVCRPV
jgi:hypothetical protein